MAGKPDASNRSPFSLKNEVVESALLTGELDGPLGDYFGEAEYARLRELARQASTRAVRGGPRVLILPGIMGSTIGKDRRIFDDVVWVDAIDIATGRLSDLALPRGKALGALGVMLIAYLKLKLTLRASGFDADFHPFDWRYSIADLGAGLKKRLDEMGGRDVTLVAHSMGGLVSRAAIAQGARYSRLIMLGTPNFGSFAPVEALRATYPVVRKIGWVDTKHTPEQLAADVFSTFPGLAEMLPFRERFNTVDLYDMSSWPRTGPGPRPAVLAAVNEVQESLSPGRDDFYLIAGIDQKTTVGLRAEPDNGDVRFVYEMSLEGDGTVPLDFCRLPGIAATYYVKESHGSLANNGVVASAVIDILEKGATDRLPTSWTAGATRGVQRVAESALRIDPYAGRRSGLLSTDEIRNLIEEVASPSSSDSGHDAATTPGAAMSVGTGYTHPFDHVVVGRRRQHRIDLRFARGSITETNSRAIALGVFSDVTPSGAASAVDMRLGGAITEMFHRRMFGARIGEVFVLPKGRHALAADFVTLVGLGSFDRFNENALQAAAENLVRTLVNSRIEEFATVLFGGGSGENPAGALQNLLTGFFSGLRDADRDHQFRRIVICEYDADRYTALKGELFRLSSTSLFSDVEITFDEEVLPAAPVIMSGERRARRRDPVYLIVRQEKNVRGTTEVRSSLLTAGGKATIVTGVAVVKSADIEATRRRIVADRARDMTALGSKLAEMLLPDQIRQVLPRYADRHLVVVHDAEMSRMPWEVLAFPRESGDVWVPAMEGGISHRYAAENLSVAKWLEERIDDRSLSILLVVNPTNDLDGAAKEGERIGKLFGGLAGVELNTLEGRQATHRALLAEFSSGKYDVIHYAGHAFYDARNPERSGILCHRSVPLTGQELSTLGNLPSLVFFNACESGRVRGGKRPTVKQRNAVRSRDAEKVVGFAEAFMRGGVASFLGTYWPVHDDAALTFADTFYRGLIAGDTLGDALLAARRDVREVEDYDWADYLYYGSPDFTVKTGPDNED